MSPETAIAAALIIAGCLAVLCWQWRVHKAYQRDMDELADRLAEINRLNAETEAIINRVAGGSSDSSGPER